MEAIQPRTLMDVDFVLIVLAILFSFDVVLLLAYIIDKCIDARASAQQLHSPDWYTTRTEIGYGFSLSNLATLISLPIYFHRVDSWLWQFCPTKMGSSNSCTQAADKWNQILWWLTLPFIIAHVVIFMGARQARAALRNHPEYLYSPGAHAGSCVSFQASLVLSTPLFFPHLIFDHVTGQMWTTFNMVLAVFTLSAYTLGVALWITGVVLFWTRPHIPRRRSGGASAGIPDDLSGRELDLLERSWPSAEPQ